MEINVQKNVLYDSTNNLTLDLYQAEKPNGYAIIIIHGGGWFQGDKEKDADWAQLFAQAGYLTVVPNYRLAPEHFYPAAREDVFSVHPWLLNSYPQLKGVGVAGSSSGGNLAIELGLAKGIPTVSWSGIIDLDDWIIAHPEVVPKKDTAQDFAHLASAQIDQAGPNDAYYKWFVLNYVNNDPPTLKAASLLHRITDAAGPMLLVNSMHELCPADAVIKLQEQLLAQNVPVMTKLIPGGQHAKGYLHKAQAYTMAFFTEFLLNRE